MGFKLIRIDAPEPAKIPLSAGAQIIGRGTFPDCDDLRMSHKHAMVTVTGETVTLKSIHQNPCFYSISDEYKTCMLPQGKSVTLKSGDHFGLLPNTNWYELIYYREITESTTPSTTLLDNRFNLSENLLGSFSTQNGNRQVLTGVNENTNVQRNNVKSYNRKKDEDNNDSDSSTPSLEVEREDESTQLTESQPSILSRFNPRNQVPRDPNTISSPNEHSQTEADETCCDVQTSPSKRCHSPDRFPDAKKVKTEPESPKTEGFLDSTEVPASTDEINTQPQDPTNTIGPQISMDIEPQDTNNVNTEPHDPNDDKTEPREPNNVNTEHPNNSNIDYLDPQSHSSADDVKKEPQDPMNVDTETKDPKYMNTESLADEAKKEPESSHDANEVKKEPRDPTDVNTEPSNVNTEPQTSEDNTEPQNQIDTNRDSLSPNDANTEPPMAKDGDKEAQSSDGINIKHEPQSPDNAKDVKKVPLNIKDEKDVKKDADVAKPGPIHDQPGCSNDGDATPKPPNPPARERCIYGANCYRKNPQHKIQFSHPGEADYGEGAKGHCPYGASCRRREPRHWTHHEHPPGTVPPHAPPPHRDHHNRQGIRVLQRRGQIYYVNAHSVHFHDDRYELEDQDGNRVDYDYEF